MKLGKTEIFWSYLSQIVSYLTQTVVMILSLQFLSKEELGLNYLMVMLGNITLLLDFGFSPQISRNITYIFSGANDIKATGFSTVEPGQAINYELLAKVINATRFLYRRISIIAFILLSTFGLWYVYNITDAFDSVPSSFYVWLIYSISVVSGIYYSYYYSFLNGSGLILEARKITVYSKVTQAIATIVFLVCGFGLYSIAFANLLPPIIIRFYSEKTFFSENLKNQLRAINPIRSEILVTLGTLWVNAKKLGLVFVSGFLITKISFFIAGIYLSLEEVASFGLLIQIISLVSSLSMLVFSTIQPKLTHLRIKEQNSELLRLFSLSLVINYVVFVICVVVLMLFGERFLLLINSNTMLPVLSIVLSYSLIIFLENNHSIFATLILSDNEVPFVKASILSGLGIMIFGWLGISYFSFGLLGLIIVQGVMQLAYNNWKWPVFILTRYRISYRKLLFIGIEYFTLLVKREFRPLFRER